jgi:hypothetical protein
MSQVDMLKKEGFPPWQWARFVPKRNSGDGSNRITYLAATVLLSSSLMPKSIAALRTF